MNKVLFSIVLLIGFCAVVYAQQSDKHLITGSDGQLQPAPQPQPESAIPLLPPTAAQQPQQQQTIPTLQMGKKVQWEYMAGNSQQGEDVGFLNSLGDEGWELIVITEKTCVFKRPKR